MWIRLAALPITVLLAQLTVPLLGAELTVGPNKSFTRIEAALAKASPGDVILVYPLSGAQPYAKVAVSVAQPNITFRAVTSPGQRVRLSGLGYNYSGRGSTPRAIFQFDRGADNSVLEGFELSEAHNDSHNGAGVRINQANDVTVGERRLPPEQTGQVHRQRRAAVVKVQAGILSGCRPRRQVVSVPVTPGPRTAIARRQT